VVFNGEESTGLGTNQLVKDARYHFLKGKRRSVLSVFLCGRILELVLNKLHSTAFNYDLDE
jgi:hypothetical protein